MHRHLIVLEVSGFKKLSSGLYKPRSDKFRYTDKCVPCWIVSSAADCLLPWKLGTKCYLPDYWEFEDVGAWEDFVDPKDFPQVFKIAEDLEGTISLKTCHENSIIAVDD